MFTRRQTERLLQTFFTAEHPYAFPAGGKISAQFTKKTAAATVSGSESFRFYLNAKYFSLIAFIRPLIALSVARAFSFSLSVPKKTRFMSRPSSKHASL